MLEYETPQFLQNRSTEDIYARIRGILPPDIDISEGSHGWNLTRPIALVAAEICEFILPEVVKLIIPDWSYGEFLEGHAKGKGIYPREAVSASGVITITGEPKTVIPAGSLFSVPSVNDEPAIDYATTEEVTINSEGNATVGVECTQPGTVGNTPANTIVLISSKLTKVTSVTNDAEITGGAEAESDDSLKERIDEYDRTQGYSFVGNDADYKRWAISVPGVGGATVIPPEDESGRVTIVVTDENGGKANKDLLDAVYEKIMSPSNRNERLAPVGADLSVVAPDTFDIGITAVIELEAGATIDSVKKDFAAVLSLYLPEAMDEEEVKYSQIWAKLASVSGVADFKDLRIGIADDGEATYGTNNIPITDKQLPVVDQANLTLSIGTV